MFLSLGHIQEAKSQYVYNWDYTYPMAEKSQEITVWVEVEGEEIAEVKGFQIEWRQDDVTISINTVSTLVTGALGLGKYKCTGTITAPPWNPLNPYYDLYITLFDEDQNEIGWDGQGTIFVSP